MPFNQNTTQNTVVYQTSELPIKAVLANDTAAHANNNNTIATQSDFTFAVGKYERFIGELGVWYFAQQAKDFKYKINVPSGGTLNIARFGLPIDADSGGSGNEDKNIVQAVTATTGEIAVATGDVGAGIGYLKFEFNIINAGTAGDFTFQWAPNTAVDNAGYLVYLRAGSYLKYKRF